MENKKQQEFINWWEQKRQQKPTFFQQYRVGVMIGLFYGLAILISIITGWYKRAIMQTNSMILASILLLGFIAISLFFGWIYNQYSNDRNEQRYQELKQRLGR